MSSSNLTGSSIPAPSRTRFCRAVDELTHDGLGVAEAKGSKGGRRPVVTAGKADDVRAAYLDGQSIAGLAREHHVSRGAIRRPCPACRG
ncbi:hypothetical protein [Streptomyces sp. NPDC006368]|uniref:hypothetical protein n=1 Tax=Streptomyces sp. NPDC006368 TaxID=3156760 RepID=UPI0033A57726